jgi:hypothetical protein
MQESRISARYVVAFPALMMLAALGMEQSVRLLGAGSPRARSCLLAVMVSVVSVLSLAYYFDSHLPTLNDQLRNDLHRDLDSDDALLRSVDFPAGTTIHIIAEVVMSENEAQKLVRFRGRRSPCGR